MSRTVTGTLLLPNGQPMANARIFFTAKRTEAVSIVEGVNAFFDTDNDGDYSQTILDGWYSVSIEWQADAAGATVRRWQLGNAVVEVGASTTLEALIIASNPAASVETTLLYEVLAEAQQAAAEAQASANAAAVSAASVTPTTGPGDTTPGHLWRTNDLVKAISPTDTTPGSVVTVGWQALGSLGSIDMADLPTGAAVSSVPNSFVRNQGSVGAFPVTYGIPFSAAGIKSAYNSSRGSYIFTSVSGAPRGGFVSASADNVYNQFAEWWTTANLTKTASFTDTTPGRLMQVSDAGIMSVPVNNNNADSITHSGFFRNSSLSGVGYPTAAIHVGINLPFATGMVSFGAQTFIRVSDDSGNYTNAAPRIYWRVKNAAGTFGAPIEAWTTGNTSTSVQALLSAASSSAIRSAINASSLPPYTLGTVPSASANTNLLIVITDLAGGREPCFSNGTNWLRCSDKSIAN